MLKNFFNINFNIWTTIDLQMMNVFFMIIIMTLIVIILVLFKNILSN